MMSANARGLINSRLENRSCHVSDTPLILEIINEAAQAYRGSIPTDCFHEPYMSRAQLNTELSAGVSFQAYQSDGSVIAVMGLQTVRGVDLIRHAYVRPAFQGTGIGGRLLKTLLNSTRRPVLVGTWAGAEWAIRFYQRHGFTLVKGVARSILLETYWSVSARQRDVSVVLSGPEVEVPKR